MCDTPNWPLGNTSLLPTGHWGMAVFDSNMRHVKHIKHWKPSRAPRRVTFDHIIQSQCLSYRGDSQPASEEHPITPNRPLRNGCIWQHYRACETHQTLKTISGCLDVLFWTTWFNPDVCLIEETPNQPVRNTQFLPISHCGTAAVFGDRAHQTLKTMSGWSVISEQIILSLCMHHVWDSQPATEEWLHLTAIWGTWNTLDIENHHGGPWCLISRPKIVSWNMHYVWYSQPDTEEHIITPNRTLRNCCIWQQYEARETH